MTLLLDTHALLWCLADDERLGPQARAAIVDPGRRVLVSVASLWEIVVKIRVGTLEIDFGAVESAIDEAGFERLPVKRSHLSALARLQMHHRDPFDHLLMAQSIDEGACFVSADRRVPLYPVEHLACGALAVREG